MTVLADTLFAPPTVEDFCSDIVSQGVGSVSELARQLGKSDDMFFWWD